MNMMTQSLKMISLFRQLQRSNLKKPNNR
jgi:hypothetical protein